MDIKMKAACFIPIKANSERVPGKNCRLLNKKPLYSYIVEHALEANCFDDIFVDTNSEEIKKYAISKQIKIIDRLDILVHNTANGNDLLNYHISLYPEYDYYFQLFATAPFLQAKSIKGCYDILINSEIYDSCFTALKSHGFYWYNNLPVNYRPNILPRSQDMIPLIEETTGLYGITREALLKYRCRIGKNPFIYGVDKFEAVDINTETDFLLAEFIGKTYWNY